MTLVEERRRVRDLFKEWSAISAVFTTPIVYHPGGWEDTLPEHIKRSVIEQRLEMVLNGGWDTATDAEVVCYLYTACLVQSLDRDWSEIYFYETALLMPEARQSLDFIPDELTDWQRSELRSLKRKIRDSQLRRRKSNRKEKDMAQRKIVLEEYEADVLVGIQKKDCDPVIKTVDGSIEEVLEKMPALIAEAEEKWATSPKNPTYVAPKAAKATAKSAATAEEPGKAEDLPLLSEQAKTEEAAPEPEKEEEKPAEEAVETAEPQGAPAEPEPEPTVPPAEPEAAEPVEAGEEEEKAEKEARERIAKTPAPAAAQPEETAAPKAGEWEYVLEDGRGPYPDVQTAMDAMGMDKDDRPHHNRWDRLSKAMKEKIQRRPKQTS